MKTKSTGAQRFVGAILLPIVLTTAAAAAPRELFGYAGALGEWELVASVSAQAGSQPQELSGPLTMTHVGLCSADGPEEKKGDIRMRISESRMRATLTIDGVECRYRARLSDFYAGTMTCPDRPAVPLKIWLK